MTARFWLLDLTIDGRPYRWSTENLEVTTADGDTLLYVAGLDDLSLAASDEATVTVTDEEVDWPTMAPEVQGQRVTLRRWTEGTVLEEAVVYSSGYAAGVEYATRHDPVTFAIATTEGAMSVGSQVPDVTARVDAATWPTTALHVIGSEGAAYPVIFGYPGYDGTDTHAVVPVPLAQWKSATAATSYVVVAEDPDASITTVLIRNETLGVEADETATFVSDLLDQRVRVATFSTSSTPLPTAATDRLFAGYDPAGGGGAARTAYDVIEYVLRRWGPESVDWSRLRSVEDALTPYLCDTWIDQVQSDPWAWLETAILPHLPVEVRFSDAGRYLVRRRYVSDPTRQVGSISVDAGEADRRGSVLFEDAEVVNEFVAHYRNDRDGNWLGKLVLTGREAPRGIGRLGLWGRLTEAEEIVASARCLRSATRYGLRQNPGGPITIDFTWDQGTVIRVLEDMAEREALPARLATYEIPDGEDLEEGDEVLLTDTEVGLTDAPAIVDTPPVRGDTTTVTFRIPEEA